jgi:hypothetical protein
VEDILLVAHRDIQGKLQAGNHQVVDTVQADNVHLEVDTGQEGTVPVEGIGRQDTDPEEGTGLVAYDLQGTVLVEGMHQVGKFRVDNVLVNVLEDGVQLDTLHHDVHVSSTSFAFSVPSCRPYVPHLQIHLMKNCYCLMIHCVSCVRHVSDDVHRGLRVLDTF